MLPYHSNMRMPGALPVTLAFTVFFYSFGSADPLSIPDDCYEPLGMGDGRIKDSAITAPSVYRSNISLYGPGRARLNHPGGYRAEPTSSKDRILEINFRGEWIVTGIATQGYFGDNIQEWTKRYILGYRIGFQTSFFQKGDTQSAEVFLGNTDNNSVVFHNVTRPAKVHSVILFPGEWFNNFAIRMELYGCIADGNECLSSPCQNDGICVDKERSYVCNCTAGFNGTNCEENIGDCASSPCQNGARCNDLVNDFACNCTPGYTGKNCSEEINECNSNPCYNNGTCIDLLNGYHCNCSVGYDGTQCELDIDDCSSNPCFNNATCLDGVNYYSCNCSAGFTGKQCETDVDECSSNPCLHAGTCADHVNGYSCTCAVGFAGLRCQKETEFYLVAWFRLKNAKFTYFLINESSTVYRTTKKNVIDEVNNMLHLEDKHFFGSALRRFSPSNKDSVIAEVFLRTLSNSTSHIIAVLKEKMKSQTGIFESENNFNSYENRAYPGCHPPNITLHLSEDISQRTKINKSEDLTVPIKAHIDCPVQGKPGKVQVLYTIASYVVDLTSASFRRVKTNIGTLVSDFNWTIRGREMNYGLYYLKLTANIEKQAGTLVSRFGFLEVSSTPLVAKIEGKTEASQGFSQMLTLNGSRSYDPDVGPGDYSGLSFTWLCRKKNEKFPDDIASLPVVTPVSGSPSADVHGGCYGTGIGKLKARVGIPYLVDLDVDDMEGGEDYVVKLVLTKSRQTSGAIHSVRIQDAIDLSIECIQNCQQPTSISTRLTLETRCTGLFCGNIESYVWSVEYLNKSYAKWQKIANLDDSVLTYANSPNLVTREGKLIANSSYLVTVNGSTPNGHFSVTNYSFFTNTPPVGGSCSVDKSEGRAWETSFIFRCSGWRDDDLPLRYKFRYNTSDGIMMVFQSGPSSKATGKLPVGDENKDYNLHVQVQIFDARGSSAEWSIFVRVMDPEVTPENLFDAVSEEGAMNEYLKANDIQLAAQRATAVLSVVNHAELTEVEPADRMKIKASIIESWSSVNVSNLEEISSVSAVVASAASKRDELSIGSQETAVGILDSMTVFMTSQVRNMIYHEKKELVEEVGTAILNGMGNLLDVTSFEARKQRLDEDSAPFAATIDRKEKGKSFSKGIIRLIDEVGNNLLYTKELHEKPSALKTHLLSILLDRQVPSKIGDKTLQDQGSKVTLPSAQDLIRNGSENQKNLSTQLVTFRSNPYTWHESASSIKSAVLDFELKDFLGHQLNVSNLNQEIELFIPPLQTPEVNDVENYFVKPFRNGTTMRFHKIEIPGSEYAVSIRITPLGDKNVSVFVRYGERPTLEKFHFTATVPDYSSCNYTEETGFSNCSTDPFVVTVSTAITGHTGLHFVGIMYKGSGSEWDDNSPNPVPQPRVRRACSHGGRQKRSCVGVKDPPTTPPPIKIVTPFFNASTDVNYTMSVTMATCLFWNVTAEKWTAEGCRGAVMVIVKRVINHNVNEVGPKATPEALQCLCTHLSSFGGDFFVAPNPIDFDYVFSQFPNIFESGNVVVLATVLSIFGLYIIGLVIARRADRKDERKAVESLRVHTEGEHPYEVSVYTGMWKGSGTSAHVAMVVYDEESRSEILHLFDNYSDKKLFARASITNFIVSLPDSIHSPVMIKLWHDNSGSSPSWYVNQVVVRDLETEEKWYFLCNRWLAVDKEDGEVEVDIPLATKRDLGSFKYQFSTRLARNLGDGHIWLSVVTRPPHSPFTRAQRLSCCVCVLLCAMLAGAMFYQFGEKKGDTINFGPLRFSVRQLVIGAESALVVVPLNLLVVTIFRNVKTPHNVRTSQHRLRKTEKRNQNSSAEKEVQTPGCLPHFFVYFGWMLCILASLTAATFVIFYSVQWGTEVSNQWLTSALISFIQDIAVMQPIKVIALAVVLAVILKKPPEEKTAQSIENSDLEVNKNMAVVAPKGDELLEARKYRESVLDTISTLVEVVFFLLFVVCLFIVVYGNRGTNRYQLTSALENLLKDSFQEVDSRAAFWEWIKEEFLPGVYKTSWYNDQTFIGPEGYISTREAFLVGMPKLRQVRVKEEYPCEVTSGYSSLETIFKRCIPFYSPDVEDTRRFYLPRWIPVTNMSLYGSRYEFLRLCPKPWRYNTSGELDTLSFEGRNTKYEGGGYVADLGYNYRTATGVILNLESNNWIDERTAAVFVEFTVFEPSSSLFSVVKFLYEVLPTGKPETRTRIDTLSIYASSNPSFRSFFVACQMILVLLIAYFLLLEIVTIYRQSSSYFRSFWNWMNLLQLILAIITVAFFFFKEKYVSSFVKRVQANPFETASTDYVLFWSELELIVLSAIVFIVTVKFLRIIRFNRHVCQMISSLKLSMSHVVSYSVLFFIDLMSFALLGVLAFGNDLEAYHSFVEALNSLFQKFLGGDLHFYELQSINRVLGPAYVFAYMISMGFILINMFVAILNDSYESVKELSGGKFADAELGVFIKEYYLARLMRLHQVTKRKLGHFGFHHRLYDRSKTESKVQLREDFVGSFLSLPSGYPLFVESESNINYSSQLTLLDNLSPNAETESRSDNSDCAAVSESEHLMRDVRESDSSSVDSNGVSSNAELFDLLGDLPESMVDDDDTIDNVRKDLAAVGAVLRLSKRTLRRFSKTGDKYVVQKDLQIGPSVAVTFRSRKDSDQ